MSIKIVTDSAADLTEEELRQFGITQAPLFIHFPEGEISSASIKPDDFYDRLEAMRPAFPTTSQPSAGMFAGIYESLAGGDNQVLSLHISSGLSGTLASAQAGRDTLPLSQAITLWDTLTLSGGQRFQVLAAAQMAQAGASLETIEQRLAEIRAQTELIYTLDTLEYLARGGRIGRVQALASSLLNIKPLICVEHADGKYSTAGKVRSMGQALTAIADHFARQFGSSALWVTILHGRSAEKAASLGAQLAQRLNIARIETVRISPALGVHTGPGVVGAAAVPVHLMPDRLLVDERARVMA